MVLMTGMFISASAQDATFDVGDLRYNILSPADLTCEVYGPVDKDFYGDIVIPSSVSFKNKELSVINIRQSAFNGCSSIKSISIPTSVTTIGSEAFSGCTSLVSISIPNSVTSLRERVFQDCPGLTGVDIPNSVTSIGDYAFYCCTGLTSVDIPDSVTSIGEYAFYGCTGLMGVTIGDSVTSIGSSAFYGCTGLTGVDIPDSVTEIGWYAFSYCTGLTSVTIGNSVTSIGMGAFSYCTGLTSIDIPDSVTSIGRSAFYGCTGLTGVDIPDSVTSIGYYVFYGCTGLTDVKISANVTWFGADDGSAVFEGCDNIVNLTFNDSGESLTIENYHSYSSTPPVPFRSLQLKELYLGREINLEKYDSSYIYEYPETLEKITFGPQLSEIGDFYSKISTIPTSTVIYCLNPTPPAFGNYFANSQYVNNTVYVPKESLEAYQQAEGWMNFWDLRAYDPDSGIEDMKAPGYQGYVVYDLQGNMVLRTENKAELSTLARGIYIVNGKKVLLP